MIMEKGHEKKSSYVMNFEFVNRSAFFEGHLPKRLSGGD
jgi:hypothetical protein